MYWLSRRTRNDQFLLYCFAESTHSDDALHAEIRRRCAAVPELRTRVQEGATALTSPRWVPADPAAARIRQHRLPMPRWPELLTALGRLTDTGVDARDLPWELHIFRGIHDSPAPDLRVTVVVLQISHALVDGRGASNIARALFVAPTTRGELARPHHQPAGTFRQDSESELSGSPPIGSSGGERSSPGSVEAPGSTALPGTGEPVPSSESCERTVPAAREPLPGDEEAVPESGAGGPAAVHGSRPPVISAVRSLWAAVTLPVWAAVTLPVGVVRTARRGMAAGRARKELAELTAAGRVPPPGTGYPPGLLNGPADVTAHAVRMLVCPARDFRAPGLSVTVVGLTAVSIAVERYLRGRGADVTRLGAQVPMALPPRPGIRNNHRSLGVDLAAGEPDPRRRATAIAAELAARRERGRHPLLDAQDAVDAVLPPLLLCRDVRNYPIHSIPEQITGHTVVSSVNRGPADLTFGGAPVRFTGGFPALGSVMHLTHGIHGLGETVTISVHADPGVVDPDEYAGHLRDALRELSRLRD